MPAEIPDTLTVDLRHVLPTFELCVAAELPLAGVTGLFGPSGSGKSTLLRLVAGFETGRGAIRAGADSWFDSARGLCLPAHARPVGYVFQDARLFAHLSVAGNLRYAERRRRRDGPTLAAVVAALDLEPLLARGVGRLSGGERQRVALARTLVGAPRLLLLDEPLASLDARRRADILPYLESVTTQFGIPTIYVSHTIDEVIQLADRVIVLEHGRVAAQGETATVFNCLRDPAAGPAGDMSSVLETRVVRHLPDLHLTELNFEGQAIFVPQLTGRERGAPLRLRVRAGEVALAVQRPLGLSFRNVLAGRLHDIAILAESAFALATIDVGSSRIACHLTRQAVIELELKAGMPVYALLKTAAFDERSAR